jgi:hypothetical protein
MPGFIKPQLATLKSKAPKGDQWLHEIKYDGYRIQVLINSGRKKVYTRNGLDWTNVSPPSPRIGHPGEAIIDGELVVVHEGRTNFSELRAELAAGRQDRLTEALAIFPLPRNGQHIRILTPMDRFCLQIICASILLLVTAFALGTPGLKSDGASETTSVLRRQGDERSFVLPENASIMSGICRTDANPLPSGSQ